MRTRLRALFPLAILASCLLTCTPLRAQQSPQLEQRDVPAALQPPVDEKLLLQLHGSGDQIYSCKSDAGEFHWILKAPEAQLSDASGRVVGKHFAGPSWQTGDGTMVTGKPANSVASDDAESIPWLLIKVVSHKGTGPLARATTIQRLNTKGGKAPGSGCDSDHVNQEVRVAYSADYNFYGPK